MPPFLLVSPTETLILGHQILRYHELAFSCVFLSFFWQKAHPAYHYGKVRCRVLRAERSELGVRQVARHWNSWGRTVGGGGCAYRNIPIGGVL